MMLITLPWRFCPTCRPTGIARLRLAFSARLCALHLTLPLTLTLTPQDDVAPPGLSLDLHVRRWRRFLELPLDQMLAVGPDTARGRFRVAVWITPEMTGPQAARLVALHARYHVGVLGFDEEQVRIPDPDPDPDPVRPWLPRRAGAPRPDCGLSGAVSPQQSWPSNLALQCPWLSYDKPWWCVLNSAIARAARPDCDYCPHPGLGTLLLVAKYLREMIVCLTPDE